jgi:hypothetical protein
VKDENDYVRQVEAYTHEPLATGPSRLEVEIAIAKLKKYKPPDTDQISANPIQAGGEMRSTISLVVLGIRKNCLSVEGCYYCTNSQKG